MKRRLVLAGNNLAAIHVLDLAVQLVGASEVLVVAPPGGVHHSWQPSLARYAEQLGIATMTPANVNTPEVVDELAAFGADLLLSVYYTQLFRPKLLELFPGRALNFHPSLLPRHRGTAPLIWAIVDGDTKTGLSVHHMEPLVDSGRLVAQHTLPIHPQDTGHSLHLKTACLVRAVASRLLRAWSQGEPVPAGWPQSGNATYHSSKDPTLNHLDWRLPRERVRNIARALAPPLPGAFSLAGSTTITWGPFTDASITTARAPGQPGLVEYDAAAGTLQVWAADGPLLAQSLAVDGGAFGPPDATRCLRLDGTVLA